MRWPVLEIFMVAVGLCSLAWSVVLGFRTATFIRGATETTGEVVRLEKSKGNFLYARHDYAPVFRFTAADGKTHTVTSKIGTSPPGFEVGDMVQVRYDTADPEGARTETLLQTWGGTIIYGFIGVVSIGFVILSQRGAFR